ncbi:autotransporter domain-containing protein [Bradyrhizobium sp. U87765 SZCCT0134]|uniref:autotransporter family protein n=1 Tax=unclassified Bradyrhizobium TaxID=2631580 RepID=UPI001BAD7581|nr:autotransporter domain-containing protein [Bradyrhizobium sp. U87765 SZCCT0134]MBR1350119.1 autotransporter domain-containing protein [Bradyrhizobium sp. U87765 SZCCT0048]
MVGQTYRLAGLAAALLVSTALTAPAFADGGNSGFWNNPGVGPVYGGSGGSDRATRRGDAGEDAPGCCGGGGGGAGTIGGNGGASGVAGGAGGLTPGANGGNGATDTNGAGSGGGGGAHGFVGSVLPTVTVTGGNGGNGGDSFEGPPSALPAAGGGGAGGYGAVVFGDGTVLSGTLTVNATGGNGGAGGAGYSAQGASGGTGGSGGVGLVFTPNNDARNADFTINGAVTGGNGGAARAIGLGGDGGTGMSLSASGMGQTMFTLNGAVTGGTGGTAGARDYGGSGGTGLSALGDGRGMFQLTVNSAISGGNAGAVAPTGHTGNGGAGLVGANVLIIMGAGGSISGGTDGNGVRANALEFIGGSVNYLAFNGPTSQLTGGISLNNSSTSAALMMFTDGATVVDNVISGYGAIGKGGTGTLTLTGVNTYSQGTTVMDGTLKLSGAGTLGDVGNQTFVGPTGTLDLGGTTQTQSSVQLNGGTIINGNLNAPVSSTGGTIRNLGGTASLTTTDGVTTLLGTVRYSGATVVNGGTLNLAGFITGTPSVTVNSGGTLTGGGLIQQSSVTINSGATFAPGEGTPASVISIVGNLAVQSGATYLVQVNPSTASLASVTGAATLGGATVNAVFANGSYISKAYTILATTGGVSGTFASNVVTTNLPANFHTGLRYDANNAYLDLALNYTPPPTPTAPGFGGGLPRNQQAVANALINSFNANGGIPFVYGALTQGGLTQASGELGASSQQTTFQAMGQFMGMLTGPAGGCASQAQGGDACFSGASGSGVLGYADERAGASTVSKRAGDAFAMFTKAPPAGISDPRWSTWVMGFGGSQTTDGNAMTGSNTSTSSIYGTALGADYRLAPNTILGFALSGGGTNFSVGNGGSGRSDLFQAGAYVRHNIGAAYLSAALGYGWQDVTTDRTVAADRLRASFNANAWSGRAETGYRLVAPWVGGIGVTPYAAVQVTAFDLPAYAERAVAGTSAFALNYAGKSITDTRTELGLRTDKSFAVQDGILTLRSRFAWAHDYNADRSVAATFQALPGASFVVNGAAQARDAALTTASAEMKWRNGWSAAATFEGEFSNVTRSYGGRGVVRYSW